MFTTYVLYSQAYDKIYIGFTSDLENRVKAHNDIKNSGWTKRYQPWKIIYTEAFNSKYEAMKREKELKSSRGRNFIRNLISAKK